MKRFIMPIAALTIAAALTGCAAKEINVNELASDLAKNAKFTEQLTEVSSDITAKRYGLDSEAVEECAAYAGTKAVVDEVAVFKSKDVDTVKEQALKHIEAQKSSYSSYRPDEVPKLDDSIITVVGDYVIVCVSEDSSVAESIIAEFTK